MQKLEYSIPRPTYPIAARFLLAATLLGLIGLGLVAFEVFSLIDNPVVAGAFALVIELGAVAEAISIFRKNAPAWVGLTISLLVSVIYNYTRAAQASAALASPLGTVELVALSVGPLFAVLFLSLTLGHVTKEYERAVEGWERQRQAWADEQTAGAARAAATQAQAQAEQALKLKQIELETQAKVQLAQIRAEARAARAVARTPAQPSVQPAQVTRAGARGDYADFKLAQSARNGAGPMHYTKVMRDYNVSKRTAYNWLEKYAAEQALPEITVN